MKKVFYLFLLMFLTIPILAYADDDVDVYIFREYYDCPNCDDAANFFEELQTDAELKDKYDLEYIDVTYSSREQELMKKTTELLGTNYNGYPLIVISDKYYMGYSSSFANDIRNTILECYNNKNFKDVVEQAKKEINYENYEDEDYDYAFMDDFSYYFDMFMETMFAIVAIIFGFIGLAILIFIIVCKWILFKKCDKPGWAALIPIYNNWVFFEICGYSGYYSLLSLIPFVGYIAVYIVKLIASIALSEKFGKEAILGLTIPLIPIVGYPIFAFTKSKYQK